ncbi:hypothetical protein EZJ49_04500 [Bdellovibrio bacteriovorus]|uniref:hypothetical protein n=1 Tax=Bdellovibrio bacteriovorus TaxID=959 RepID=UPI0021D1A41B|nr:hypothetical protein [Bdellovibrio bacteriovorus]UXR65513.1 hypothetical protein EZJ49_04500 [Bdellovibrio bacteriovorus]
MKKLTQVLIASALITGLVACDAQDAIDSTKQIPDKMNQTNSKMESMLDAMKTTNKGVHDQSLLIPLENLLKEENYDTLAPVPFKLMPYGKKLAEAATAEELVELTYLWLKEVDEALPAKDIDEGSGAEIPYTKKQIQRINTLKIAKLTALQIIAGFTPQNVVQEMIQNYVIGGGIEGGRRFEETTYSFLMLRTMFIRDVLLKESILSKSIDNVGKLEEAMKYIKKIDAISRLRFHSRIEFKSRGLVDYAGQQLPSDEQPQEKFDRLMAQRLWESLYDKASAQMKVEARSVGASPEEDQRLLENEKKRIQYDMQLIQQALQYWSSLNPEGNT